MSTFELHPEVLIDLQEIGDYIAFDSPRAALKLVKEFYEKFAALAQFPRQGHKRPALTSKPLLFVVLQQYLIAYAPNETPLVIIAVIHGRRNPDLIRMILERRQ